MIIDNGNDIFKGYECQLKHIENWSYNNANE